MQPIGICGGGFVALLIFLVAIVGAALLAGGIVLLLAKIGVTVDAWLRSDRQGKSDGGGRVPGAEQEGIITRRVIIIPT